MTALLRLRGVASGYGRNHVLHDVALDVRGGEIVALIGANGAGKTTLLNTIMGLVPARSGTIEFGGQSVRGRKTQHIVRAGLSQVPERRQLFGTMTVAENLLMGAYGRRAGASVADDLERQYQRFPILRERHAQLTHTLSGGEQQMLAIARAMMNRPKLILLDEPTLGLAPLLIQTVLDIVASIRESGGSVLLVEQNARAALAIADRGYVLEAGRIALEGSAAALARDPAVRTAYLGGTDSSDGIEERIRRIRDEIRRSVSSDPAAT